MTAIQYMTMYRQPQHTILGSPWSSSIKESGSTRTWTKQSLQERLMTERKENDKGRTLTDLNTTFTNITVNTSLNTFI